MLLAPVAVAAVLVVVLSPASLTFFFLRKFSGHLLYFVFYSSIDVCSEPKRLYLFSLQSLYRLGKHS